MQVSNAARLVVGGPALGPDVLPLHSKGLCFVLIIIDIGNIRIEADVAALTIDGIRTCPVVSDRAGAVTAVVGEKGLRAGLFHLKQAARAQPPQRRV